MDREILNKTIIKTFAISRRIDDEQGNIEIIDNMGNRYVLNRAGSMIWSLVNNKRTIHDIVQHLDGAGNNEGEYPGISEIENTVCDFISRLKEKDLISYSGETSIWRDD